jgi:hypothetical protein
VEISFEDLDMEYCDQEDDNNNNNNNNNNNINKRQANSTLEPIKYSTRKFKPPPRVQSVYAPDIPKTDFEDLIKSNSTVKVSLTPNRLKSIEDNTFQEKPESFITRSRRSTLASLKRIASTVKRPTSTPVTKKKDEMEVKRPTSAPPVHQTLAKPKARSSSILSSPRTSHMSIPSLSETSKSHYSTCSLASTLSNTSLGKELSTIGEERKQGDHDMIPFQHHESITQILTQQDEPERPSSIVARRAHRLGNARPKSYHESQATQRYADTVPTEARYSLRHGVMDKVFQFERAAPRNKTKSVDQAVQTDPVESDDEEWFIDDSELEEQDEADIVNWLLGE